MQYQNEININCPYCGETLEVLIDESAGAQSYYEDCAVCCAPILFVLTEDVDGTIDVDIKRNDE